MKLRRRSIIWFALCLITVTLGLPSPARSQGPQPPLPPGMINTTAAAAPNATVSLPPPSAPAAVSLRGLSDRLEQIAAADKAGDLAQLASFAGDRHVDLANKRAQVIMEMDSSPNAVPLGNPTVETVTGARGAFARLERAPALGIRPDLAQAIGGAGATYETAYQNLVQVQAPFGQLQALANIPGVRQVRLPYPAHPDALPPVSPRAMPQQVGLFTSEGVTLTNASAWQAGGTNGSGVNLAVFDFGFTGWDTRQAAGDLPSGGKLVLKDFSASYSFGPPGTSGDEHGTACAEIAYDMAPGATVYLYAWGTDVELGNAVNDFVNNVSGKRVATMSITYVNAGPYDGTGGINSIINTAQAAGIFFAVSAGNNQKQHYSWTSAQYLAGNNVIFGSSNLEPIGPDPTHLWNITGGTVLQIFLEWNDWNASRTGNAAHIDYDLFLNVFNGSVWTQVASSTGNQCASSAAAPTEAIGYTVPSGTHNYSVSIQRVTNRGITNCPNNFGHWMELYSFNGIYQAGQGAANTFGLVNPCNSLGIPADGDSAIAVGAAFWNEDTTGPLYGLETFTSLGPRNGAGGSSPGAVVNKPDVVAPDGVSTATYGVSGGANFASGGGGFWGTSGAAPHVAGLAAVAWSGFPSYTLAQLRSYIQGNAVYKADGVCGGSGSGNQNDSYGWGRINLARVPTAVSLSSFNASLGLVKGSEHVRLAWTTATEINMAGFNLYRGERSDGPYTLLNPQLIPASADLLSGGVYQYVDTDAVPGRLYYYQLEDVGLDGTRMRHPPIAITNAAVVREIPYGALLIGWGALAALALLGIFWKINRRRCQQG